MGVVLKHLSVLQPALPEKKLVGTKNGRDQVERNLPQITFVDVVIPEFILDEDRHLRACQIKETSYVPSRIEGQVADNVGQRVIFSYFVSRGREKGEQDLVCRVLSPDCFDERASLFKLPQRCSMKPHILCGTINLLL